MCIPQVPLSTVGARMQRYRSDSGCPSSPARHLAECTGNDVDELLINRWTPIGGVAARRFRPLLLGGRETESLDDHVVDVGNTSVVWSDGDDHGSVLCRPHDQHPIVAVEVTAADVVELVSSQPVPGRPAALVLDFDHHTQGGLAGFATQCSKLSVRGGGKVDVGHSTPSRSAISWRRSSPIGTTRPAATSSMAASSPAVSKMSRSRRTR